MWIDLLPTVQAVLRSYRNSGCPRETTDGLTDRHRAVAFPRFVNLINRFPDDLDVQVNADNNATHKTPATERWLVRHPRFTLYFTPTYSGPSCRLSRRWRPSWSTRPREGSVAHGRGWLLKQLTKSVIEAALLGDDRPSQLRQERPGPSRSWQHP